MSHTADVILEAWGPDAASCYEEAVAALVDTYLARSDVEGAAERRVRFAPEPAEDTLLAVLEEVIFTLDTSEAVPVGAEIAADRDGGHEMVLRLAEPARLEPTGAIPKAVSRSELAVTFEPGRVSCRFLVDV